MQPIEKINDVVRFRANTLVRHLLDEASAGRKCGMNELYSQVKASKEEKQQFAQLIGYSVSGYGDLSYVTDEAYAAAALKAENPEKDEKDLLLDYYRGRLRQIQEAFAGPVGWLYNVPVEDLCVEND